VRHFVKVYNKQEAKSKACASIHCFTTNRPVE
jgi:hypothetical protein